MQYFLHLFSPSIIKIYSPNKRQKRLAWTLLYQKFYTSPARLRLILLVQIGMTIIYLNSKYKMTAIIITPLEIKVFISDGFILFLTFLLIFKWPKKSLVIVIIHLHKYVQNNDVYIYVVFYFCPNISLHLCIGFIGWI